MINRCIARFDASKAAHLLELLITENSMTLHFKYTNGNDDEQQAQWRAMTFRDASNNRRYILFFASNSNPSKPYIKFIAEIKIEVFIS